MDARLRGHDASLRGVAVFLLGGLLWATPALASSNNTECDLSYLPGVKDICPEGAVGAATAYATFQGATLEPNSESRSAIDAFGYCRYLGNVGKEKAFVPFGSAEEWRAYLTNHPNTIYLKQCSRGGLVSVPPTFGKESALNMCVTVTPPLQSVTVPYKHADEMKTFIAPPVTYACKAADGTDFTETATATMTPHDSGFGPSDDIGWTVSKMSYVYDGQCGPAKGVTTATAPTEGLCRVGVSGSVTGLGPFTWVCSGGNGGGKNVTCTSGSPCPVHKIDEKPCRCEQGDCYKPQYFSDSCGHTWIDKSLKCDTPEPPHKPDAPDNVDDTLQK